MKDLQIVSSFIGSLTTHGRATNGIFSTNTHPRHHLPHQRPHELAETLIPQRPPKHHLRNPILNGVPIRVPHEHVDRRDEVWLRGARGDSALLVSGGVEQDPIPRKNQENL